MTEKKCKGCDGPLEVVEVRNALSRYGHGYICDGCGLKEAMQGDFIKDRETCPECADGENEPLVARMFEVHGTKDLVELLTCLHCGYRSPTVLE